MEYNVLKQSIAAVVKANGNEEITGDLLQQVLIAMVDVLGAGYQFAGLAVPTTNPGTPDAKMFYIATQAGTYSNFGSPAPVLTGEQVAILRFSTSWTAVVLDIPTKAYVDNALSGKVDKVEGKGLSTNDLTNELVTLINGAFQKANITDELGTDATKVLSQAAITTVLLQYAKVDGYYSSLTAGAAENLVGRGSVPASFLRRTTGGSADVGTGTAKIAKLMGNSIVWNQLLNTPANSAAVATNVVTQVAYDSDTKICTLTGNGNVQFGPSGLGASASGTKWISGHKYYMAFVMKKTSADITVAIGRSVTTSVFLTVPVDSFAKASAIVTAQFSSDGYATLGFANLGENDNVQMVNNKMICVDLTKMFGAGKEPSTVAEFEALFPLDDYVNNNGEVLPFAAQKLVTIGFNQWDEEKEGGSFTDGSPSPGPNSFRSKNYIQVFPNTEYSITKGGMDGTTYIEEYDSNKTFIKESNLNIETTTFTTTANTAYIKLSFYKSSSGWGTNIPDFNICINLSWSGYRNGEYEPYELHELVVDPANWEDANGDKIFPYGGMHGVGTARDFATPDNDGFIRKATRIWDRRAYAAGDENDPAVITDGSTYTFVQLETPVETELAEPVAASYYANDFGTEEWQPANDDEPYTAPCEMQIAYAMNAVDTLRRLPENYISVGSFENFCTELATKLGAALNKNITITPTYDSENAEYDYSITIADIEG